MNPWDWITYAALALALLIGFTIAATHTLWPRIETRIQKIVSEAIQHTTPKQYVDIDAEYRQLVLDEHNRDNT